MGGRFDINSVGFGDKGLLALRFSNVLMGRHNIRRRENRKRSGTSWEGIRIHLIAYRAARPLRPNRIRP